VKTFSKKLILFLAPLVLIGAVFEFRLRSVENTYQMKQKLIAKLEQEISVLIVGSSHAYWGLAASEIKESSFNLALLSQSSSLGAQLTNVYLDKLPNLKLVVFPISYFSLERLLGKSREYWRNYAYYHFFGIPGDMAWNDFLDVRNFSLFFLYGRESSLQILASNFKISLAEPMDSRGWLPMDDGPCSPDPELAKKRLSEFQSELSTDYIAQNIAQIKTTLALTRQHHVQVAFVTIPVCKTFAQVADPQVLLRLHDNLHRLTQQFPNSKYYDYYREPRLNYSDFKDADHLNRRGALKFTKILDDEVVRQYFPKSSAVAAVVK
jgi:hypothetical protein